MGLAPAHQGQEKLFTLGPQGPLATKQRRPAPAGCFLLLLLSLEQA